MHVRVRIIAGTAAAIAAVGLAVPLAAAATSNAPSASGLVMFSGVTTSMANVPTVPIVARGAFNDTGSITLSGGSRSHHGVLVMSQGNIRVTHTNSALSDENFNSTTCQFTAVERVSYIVTGGTGAYAHASGHGLAAVTFEEVAPRRANGKCNTSNNAAPVSEVTVFNAAGPISVP